MSATPPAPLIVHVVNALRAGGLENGVINLINGLPPDLFRHAVVCLTDYDDFAKRIDSDDVPVIALHKRAGKDPSWYLRMWKTLRSLRPAIVHTRNLATIEAQAVAFLAGVPGRIHGEHGWDVYDLRGANRKYRTLRKMLAPFIHRFVPLSMELESYLVDAVGIPPGKSQRICNGVDTKRFQPRSEERFSIPGQDPGDIVLGSIGRMEPVKDPLNLVDAFILAAAAHDTFRERARLAIVGDGSLRDQALERLQKAGLADRAWLPGHRDDVAQVLRSFDLFVMPSKAEGISNTILEAMASGLPVVATRVGGNHELLREGTNGALVPAEDSRTLAEALWSYVSEPEKCARQGRQSRIIAESQFSIDRMLKDYRDLYLKMLQP